jgi:hypothetical protein
MDLFTFAAMLLYGICLVANLYVAVTLDHGSSSATRPNVWRLTMLGCAFSLIYVLKGFGLAAGDAGLNIWVVLCASQVLFMILRIEYGGRLAITRA